MKLSKKQLKELASEYKYITELGLKVYQEPVLHVRNSDLRKVLTKKGFKLFCSYFGIQTCLVLENGDVGIYLSDCESVLVRLRENRLVGSQKYFD